MLGGLMVSRRRFLQSGSLVAGVSVALPTLVEVGKAVRLYPQPSLVFGVCAQKPSPLPWKSAPHARNRLAA